MATVCVISTCSYIQLPYSLEEVATVCVISNVSCFGETLVYVIQLLRC